MSQRLRTAGYVLGGGMLIFLTVLLAYRPLWTGMYQPDRLPWGSDTLGHLLRYEYIRANIQAGNWYPQLMPEWYMGMQLLRYYGPVPYYFLYFLDCILGNPLAALNGFILFWALWGGLSWLAFRRHLGSGAAILGGMLYTLLPDLVRVAFSEGNIPRVMAAGLAPFILLCALAILKNGGTRVERLGLALLVMTITLIHAMMAAIFASALGLFGLAMWILGETRPGHLFRFIAWMGLGITGAGAWLLPSLSGGITELSSEAVGRGFTAVDWQVFLNPLARLGNIEVPYTGLALIVLVLAGAFLPWTRERRAMAIGGCGILLAVLVTPQLTALFTALPLSNLLWPVRFQGMAALFLLFAFCAGLRSWWQKSPAWALLLAGLVLLDCGVSTKLIFLRPMNGDLASLSKTMTGLEGWREATLDESRLGSAASYLFSSEAKREQVFGWGYQGARTAQNVAGLNDGLASGSLGYVIDRLGLFGVDDLVLQHSLPNAPALEGQLPANGFQLVQRSGDLAYYHRDGQPRALVAAWKALGIGRGAQAYANLFPQVVLGKSLYLEDYSSAELAQYPVLILAGFQWHHRAAAEEAVRRAAGSGVRVFIDLTGVPEEPLSRIPRFLDVWGETVILPTGPLAIEGWSKPIRLASFGSDNNLWHTNAPQNVQVEDLTFDYLGKKAVLAGYNSYGTGKVWFIGANLAYHALVEGDAQAVDLLGELSGLPAGQPTAYQAVALEGYRADSAGYAFTYELSKSSEVVFPAARHDGTLLRIDGKAVTPQSCENLVCFSAIAGKHTVEIGYQSTRIYSLGGMVSLVSWISILFLLIPIRFTHPKWSLQWAAASHEG